MTGNNHPESNNFIDVIRHSEAALVLSKLIIKCLASAAARDLHLHRTDAGHLLIKPYRIFSRVNRLSVDGLDDITRAQPQFFVETARLSLPHQKSAAAGRNQCCLLQELRRDRKSTRLNSSHSQI